MYLVSWSALFDYKSMNQKFLHCYERSNLIFSTHPAVTGPRSQITEANGIKNLFTSPLKSFGGRSLGNTICLVFVTSKWTPVVPSWDVEQSIAHSCSSNDNPSTGEKELFSYCSVNCPYFDECLRFHGKGWRKPPFFPNRKAQPETKRDLPSPFGAKTVPRSTFVNHYLSYFDWTILLSTLLENTNFFGIFLWLISISQ